MGHSPELSVVLPVLNEEALLPELHRRLTSVLQDLDLTYEILYVDDGSTDRSVSLLRDLAQDDERVKVLILSRNFGHQLALSAGLDFARGEAVVLMDSDLQDPPEVIPDLVKVWKAGVDVVYAQRKARPGESVFKRGTAFLFYRLLRAVATVAIPADTGDFRLLSRRAADALRGARERSRFMRGLVTWLGFEQGRVLYDRPARASGESKYRPGQMLRLALTATFSFSRFPISLLGVAGVAVTVGSLVSVGLGLSVGTGVLYFVAGVQLIGLWVLGQYIATIAEEVRRRPLYLLKESVNLHPIPSSPAKEA
jgi:dolichol-phosphate mannosyltransferase